MKKFVSSLLLLLVTISASAQKQYLCLITDLKDFSDSPSSVFAYLSGDIPDGLSYKVTYDDVGATKYYASYKTKASIGLLLNILAEKGFSVENIISQSESTLFLLCRAYSPANDTQNIRTIADDDEDVTEVARYNLQGLPISEKEKGIQIIVYSNYTTKTIIRE